MGLEHNPLHRPERGGKAGLTVSLDALRAVEGWAVSRCYCQEREGVHQWSKDSG